jgi:hypothetical protein
VRRTLAPEGLACLRLARAGGRVRPLPYYDARYAYLRTEGMPRQKTGTFTVGARLASRAGRRSGLALLPEGAGRAAAPAPARTAPGRFAAVLRLLRLDRAHDPVAVGDTLYGLWNTGESDDVVILDLVGRTSSSASPRRTWRR